MLASETAPERSQMAIEDRLHLDLSDDLERAYQAGVLTRLPSRTGLARRAADLLSRQGAILTSDQERQLVQAVVDRVHGLGPIQPLIDDPTIDEIMVNAPEEIFVERAGRIEPAGVRLRDNRHLRHIIDRIVAPLGRRIDESSPLVDARLPDGSRVNAIIPPLAIAGPVLTIRKFAREPFTLDRLMELGTISEPMAAFLRRCVQNRRSILISGGTGSGKTSTLNALSRVIPHGERLITIEDSAELQLQHPHRVALESRPPNLEGVGEIAIRMLVRNALRMRPDRIIVGEVRGGEAFDMLQAMNTGHRGSMTTLHANGPTDALIRLESMVLMAGFEMPLSAIRRMVGGAVEILTQQDRLPDGRRIMTDVQILRVSRTNELTLRPVFRYNRRLKHFDDVRVGGVLD
jgi:pilus assembly protein CpaF